VVGRVELVRVRVRGEGGTDVVIVGWAPLQPPKAIAASPVPMCAYSCTTPAASLHTTPTHNTIQHMDSFLL
jgi:hypothetical protein